MKNKIPSFTLDLPLWLREYSQTLPEIIPDLNDRMRIAIELSRINIDKQTGGPFGAVVFETTTQRLISLGTNLVVSANASVLHAEIVAITIAQQVVSSYNLSEPPGASYELVTSTEPCAMCFGAIHWSGIRRLVCGARDADARSIGFDEGPKVLTWKLKLEENGIIVIRDVLREKAIAVLKQYQDEKGIIYNAG
jgi:tRNA(Arg) A34 adenosine deaminase TadA